MEFPWYVRYKYQLTGTKLVCDSVTNILCFIKRNHMVYSCPRCPIASSNTDALFFLSSSFLTSIFFPWEYILYSIQSGLFSSSYDNGRELSMFNERLKARCRCRNILVYVNTRSSSIISSHIAVFQGSFVKYVHMGVQIYFGQASAHLHTVHIVQMLISLSKLCIEICRGYGSFMYGGQSRAESSNPSY